MSDTEFFDDLISVNSVIDRSGRVSPRQFSWHGQDYIITGTGRQWASETGRHILVETGRGDRFELHLNREDLCWHLVRAWRRTPAA